MPLLYVVPTGIVLTNSRISAIAFDWGSAQLSLPLQSIPGGSRASRFAGDDEDGAEMTPSGAIARAAVQTRKLLSECMLLRLV